MKRFAAFLTLCCLTLAVSAFAAEPGGAAFATYSAASGAVKTSSAYNVQRFLTKTLTVSGVTLTSSAGSPTFKNMSGTLIVQCAPTNSGPWATCSDRSYAQTAVSVTSNGVFTWDDATAYIRLKWTASTTGQKIKAWLNWLAN